MNIEVEKKDIHLIGHTAYCKDGNLVISVDTKDSNLSYILLRSILKCFGNYQIVDTYETFEDVDDLLSVKDRVFVTDLPYSEYTSINFTF